MDSRRRRSGNLNLETPRLLKMSRLLSQEAKEECIVQPAAIGTLKPMGSGRTSTLRKKDLVWMSL